jgi:hypothetical protein
LLFALLLTPVPTACFSASGYAWLVNARDVKHLPGRPKTDKLDAVWLCKITALQVAFTGYFTDHHAFLLEGFAQLAADAG